MTSMAAPCDGRKRVHRSRKLARMHARRTMAKLGGGDIATYFCETCDGWHVGHEAESARPCRFCRVAIVLVPYEHGPGRRPVDFTTREGHFCRKGAA